MVVWLEDISKLKYVRKTHTTSRTRATKPKWRGPGRMVGYETLPPNAVGIAPGWFERVVYWVAPHDWCNDPMGVYATGAPCEAVDVSIFLGS